MPRKAGVRYWERKGGGFFTTWKGKQTELALGPNDEATNGPTYREAMRQYLALAELDAAPEVFTLKAVVNAYRTHVSDREGGTTLRNATQYLFSLVEIHGAVRVCNLHPHHVEGWLASRTMWNGTTKANAYSHLMMALNWAVKAGSIKANPIRGRMSKPEARARGSEARMSAETCDLLLSCCTNDAARLLFRAMRETGCRPAEVQFARVKNLRADNVIVHPWNVRAGEYRHKTAKKTKRDRLIVLPPALAADIRAAAAGRTGDDPLFVTTRRKPWTRGNLTKSWEYARERPAFQEHCKTHGIDPMDLSPYCFRHTWLSDWVDSGRSVKLAAALCGTSCAMIDKHYAHHAGDKLVEVALAFAASR